MAMNVSWGGKWQKPVEHDPLTCEMCHDEGTGAEIAALKVERDRYRERALAAEAILLDVSRVRRSDAWGAVATAAQQHLAAHGRDRRALNQTQPSEEA